MLPHTHTQNTKTSVASPARPRAPLDWKPTLETANRTILPSGLDPGYKSSLRRVSTDTDTAPFCPHSALWYGYNMRPSPRLTSGHIFLQTRRFKTIVILRGEASDRRLGYT